MQVLSYIYIISYALYACVRDHRPLLLACVRSIRLSFRIPTFVQAQALPHLPGGRWCRWGECIRPARQPAFGRTTTTTMSAGFRGVSSDQDARFTNKDAKLLKTMRFPEELDRRVEFSKVNMESIKPWVSKRLAEILGFEDEVRCVRVRVKRPRLPRQMTYCVLQPVPLAPRYSLVCHPLTRPGSREPPPRASRGGERGRQSGRDTVDPVPRQRTPGRIRIHGTLLSSANAHRPSIPQHH